MAQIFWLTDKLPSRLGWNDNNVHPVVPTFTRILVRRNLRSLRESQQIDIEWQEKGILRQKHLVVSRSESAWDPLQPSVHSYHVYSGVV
jgi:hypothetical protein